MVRPDRSQALAEALAGCQLAIAVNLRLQVQPQPQVALLMHAEIASFPQERVHGLPVYPLHREL